MNQRLAGDPNQQLPPPNNQALPGQYQAPADVQPLNAQIRAAEALFRIREQEDGGNERRNAGRDAPVVANVNNNAEIIQIQPLANNDPEPNEPQPPDQQQNANQQ